MTIGSEPPDPNIVSGESSTEGVALNPFSLVSLQRVGPRQAYEIKRFD